MNRELQQVFERIGYDELYERYIPGLSSPSARGERTARSPFPDIVDSNPSFSVNIYSGLWHCFKSERGGNYVQFRALMEANEFDEYGRAIPDFDAAERRLLVEFGVVNPIDPSWIEHCRNVLYQDRAIQQQLLRFKPWDWGILYGLGVGYDESTDRFVLPAYDREGRLVNCRMYRPGGQPKMLWRLDNFAGNFVFPHCAWNEQVVILAGGEPDVLTLRSLGFAALSGTLGEGTPVPSGMWYRGKFVYIMTDDDEKGHEAAKVAGLQMRADAKEVRVCKLPDWPTKPKNADISDLVMYLYRAGYAFEAVQRQVVQILNESILVEHPHAVFDQSPSVVEFGTALSSNYLNQRISFTARLTARSEKRFILPTVFNIICPAGGHNYCRRCPMFSEFHGNARLTHDPRAAETLKLIQGSERDQMDAIKHRHGFIKQCPDPTLVIQEAVNVEAVMLNSPIVDVEGLEPTAVERQRREALVILNGTSLEENREYEFQAFVYPHPKSQHGIFLIDRYTPSVVSYENFRMTSELHEKLMVFQPKFQETVIEKLVSVVDDLSNSVTMIKGRRDLHLAYRTVYHSVLAFDFCGSTVQRGWIEALVVGDTRCGKSIAFRRMAEYYTLGLLIDCKNQSPAGILGSVVQSQHTGERFVVPGLLPQQDERIVCFDEFATTRWAGRQGLIDVLSSTRSEGVVRISKAAAAQFRARVRSIWLANPGMGKLISELGVSGVEIISRLITQPEDIARFDFALTVSQGDVPVDVINQVRAPDPALYPRELAQSLLSWTYSRKPDQVRFTPAAEALVIEVAREMYTSYDPSIPLVEPADQRTRVAKVAVSIAAQCFSTDATGELIIVKEEHVYAARSLFSMWYDKAAMGYDRYSRKIREERTLRNPSEVHELFKSFGAHGKMLAEELLRLDEFTERTFGTLVPTPGMLTRGCIQQLYANRCIRLVSHGRRESYETTPAFVDWLKWFIANG